MQININEVDLQKYIEDTINKKIDALTDDYLNHKIQELLFDRLDGIFQNYDKDIRNSVDKYVKEYIESHIPIIDDERISDICTRISSNVAYRLKESIIRSIAFNLMPEEEDIEED